MTTIQSSLFDDAPVAGEFLLPPAPQLSTCRSCGAAICWTHTDSGARVPLDMKTVRALPDGRSVAVTHFADCPEADGWRKKKRK